MSRLSKYNMQATVEKCKEYLSAGAPIICFDLETTGLSTVEDRILSFSAIKCILKNGVFETVETKNIFINPERHIPEIATSINHIDDEMVKDCPTEDVAVDEIMDFFGENPLVCGYNSLRYDSKLIENMYLRTRGVEFTPLLHIDVLYMAKEKLDYPNYKLENIAHQMGVDSCLEFHNSKDDVIATFRIFTMLLKEYEEIQKGFKTLRVKKATYWQGHNHMQTRIYINTSPHSKTYYDVYKNEWRSDEEIDLELMERDVLRMYQVGDIKELVRKIAQ